MSYFFKRSETFLALLSAFILVLTWLNFPELSKIFAIVLSLLMLLNFFFFRQIIQMSKYRFTFIPQRVFNLYGFTATGIAVALIGIIFKQLFIEGSNFLLICGLLMMGLSTLIHTLIYKASKKRNAFKVVKRLFFYFSITSFFYFVPNNLFVHLNLRKYPEYAEIVRQSMNDPGNLELRVKMKEEKRKLEK